MSSLNFGDWKVNIIQRPQYNMSRIYLMQYIRGGVVFLAHTGDVVTVIEGQDYKDENVWFAEMTNDQMQALANAMAQNGIKTVNDHKNEGLLEATKYHLEDMRKIAKVSK